METSPTQTEGSSNERAPRSRTRTEFADQTANVQRLVEQLAQLADRRAARLARARRLLITGQLDDRAVYLETARRMLGLVD